MGEAEDLREDLGRIQQSTFSHAGLARPVHFFYCLGKTVELDDTAQVRAISQSCVAGLDPIPLRRCRNRRHRLQR